MGLFTTLSDLLNEDSDGSLEKKLVGAIDRVEATLQATLDKAEDGLTKASDAVDKLESASKLAEEKVTTAAATAEHTIDDLQKKL